MNVVAYGNGNSVFKCNQCYQLSIQSCIVLFRFFFTEGGGYWLNDDHLVKLPDMQLGGNILHNFECCPNEAFTFS